MSKTLSIVPAGSADFAQAKHYLQMAKVSAAQSVAFMILAGGELTRLHKTHGISQGKRTDLTSPNGGGSWEKIVDRELGISDTTAQRYMDMFRGAKKRVPLLNAKELLTIPLGELPEEKQKKIVGAVSKATDGMTAQEVMWEWGFAKRPQGGSARGGAKVKASDTNDNTTEDGATEQTAAQLAKAATERLIALLEEAKADKKFHAAAKDLRKKLHGLLLDLQGEVAETLK